MGISHFYSWWKRNFAPCIKTIRSALDETTPIDNLLVDLNACFHGSAQKVYRYGNFKGIPPTAPAYILQRRVCEDVCRTIDSLVVLVKPQNRLYLCVDGPAPYAKITQQRRRRFRSAMDSSSEQIFDSNAITPGTQFMDSLTHYIDWYIRKKITEDINWKDIEVVFSNEKAPGEGEAKIFHYLRTTIPKSESACVHGSDADLIMLALGTHRKNMYILRDDMYDAGRTYFLVDISTAHDYIADLLEWECEGQIYDRNVAIDDFVALFFTIGNDFLSHVPSLEIIEGGVEVIIEMYQKTGSKFGHITKRYQIGTERGGSTTFNKEALKYFFQLVSEVEEYLLQQKISRITEYFPDELLSSCVDDKGMLDIEKYRRVYTETHFGNDETEIEAVCMTYLEGMNWVLSYYKHGVSSWTWFYPYHHGPLATTLAQHIDKFRVASYGSTRPMLPFEQLISVLPPKSSGLLPHSLGSTLNPPSEFNMLYCPEKPEIDLSGKKNDWQGIVMLPVLYPQTISTEYMKKENTISIPDQKRNRLGRAFSYKRVRMPYLFSSRYGNLNNCYTLRVMV